MRCSSWLALSSLIHVSQGLQTPFTSTSSPTKRLISPETESYIHTLQSRWTSTGLSLAVVRRDTNQTSGWHTEFGSYGIATADGAPVTPDTVFAIASNSKLFLAISVGLLITNETLHKERGKELTWTTKIRDVIPEWGLMDEVASSGTSIQDMLSHRTGLPRHDFSGTPRKGGVAEMISLLRTLRLSAEFRETFQYNNLMFETLSHLPRVLLNQSYESYIAQHLFAPLNMTSSTYSVREAETRGTMAHGFQWDMRDTSCGVNGTLKATVPYFQRPGEEEVWAGAGGVLSSARDLAEWTKMLMNDGKHPTTNKTIVPEEVLDRVTRGITVAEGKAAFPELSPTVYASALWRYSYQGRELVEHGGNNPGYKTQLVRFPNDNLGVVSLANDANGGYLMEAAKWRVVDDVLGLEKIAWNDRYEKLWSKYVNDTQQLTPRPEPTVEPTKPILSLEGKTFSHPAYGALKPCHAPPGSPLHASTSSSLAKSSDDPCPAFLQTPAVQRLLSVSNLSIPTLVVPWNRSFATHLRLSHFAGDTFNVTVVWSNAEVREREGYFTPPTISSGEYNGRRGEDSDFVLVGLDEHFEVEWVHEPEEGLAFRGGFWGKEGPDSREPEGNGKDGAEVWFGHL